MAFSQSSTRIMLLSAYPVTLQAALLETISNITRDESNLSYRTAKEIRKTAAQGAVWCFFVQENFAGFLMGTPLSSRRWELHALYFKPEFRGQGYAHALITHATHERSIGYFVATFLKPIEAMFIRHHEFRQASLSSLSLEEKIRFILPRLKPHRLKEVFRHRRTHELSYVLKEPV